jgi:ribosome-associated protein
VPDRVRVTPSCVIDADELGWRFTASGGPGGQHANTANTKVEVRFDVESSPSLGPRQRARLVERLGPVVRVVASDRRSQAQNRELALERLKSKLAAALHVDPARRPSKPSKSAVEKRLQDKRRQSERKARRRVSPQD